MRWAIWSQHRRLVTFLVSSALSGVVAVAGFYAVKGPGISPYISAPRTMCGQLAASLVEPSTTVVADEPFNIAARLSIPKGRLGSRCQVASGANFLDRDISIIAAQRGVVPAVDGQTLKWTAKAHTPGLTSLTVIVSLSSEPRYREFSEITLEKTVDIAPSRRVALSQNALNSYADAMNASVKGTGGTQFKADQSYFREVIITGKGQSGSPGLNPQVTIKVCVERSPAIVAPASDAESCVNRTQDLRQPVTIPMNLELRTSQAGPIRVFTSVTVTGENDGKSLHKVERKFSVDVGSVYQTSGQKIAKATDTANKWLVAVGGAAGLTIFASMIRLLRRRLGRRRRRTARHGAP